MKKLLLSIPCVLMMFFFSCSKEESLKVEKENEQVLLTFDEQKALVAMKSSHTIKISKAQELAEKAELMFNKNDFTKSKRFIYNVSIGINPATKGNKADTMFYIFNYAKEEGCAIISADERSKGLLAFIEKGNVNIGDTLENNGSCILLSNIYDYQQAQINLYNHLKDSLSSKILEKIGNIENYKQPQTKSAGGTFKVLISALVKTNWGQRHPFNRNAKINNGIRCSAGCFAIATAQLIAFHGNPRYFNNTDYNLGVIGTKNYFNLSKANQNIVALFIAKIGYMCKNNWSLNETTSSIENARDCLVKLDYTIPLDWNPHGHNFNLIKNSLYNNRPIFLTGFSKKKTWLGISTYYSCHGWLADGLGEYRRIQVGMNPITGKTIVKETVKEYLHSNFGWAGVCNGYYLKDLYDTNNDAEFTKNGENGNYKYKLKMYENIYRNN